MPTLRSQSVLTIEERAAKHRLVVRDALALSGLLTIIISLTFVTYLLFHSFTGHKLTLMARWKVRGETALANHQPVAAIDSLRSALAYAPDDRGLQIELATALAAAGRTQEAEVYFDTLHEAEPGNGMINLQLARLAVHQGSAPQAINDYQAALDGTWNGDGFLRRREVRLELSRYLVAQRRYDEARNQLLIAAGNAADNHALQLTVAGLLEAAEGDADAYNLYRKAMTFPDTRTAGMVGAGRTAAAQSRYLLARNLLQQALQQPDFDRLPQDEQAAVHSLLDESVAILNLFPAENLSLHVRAVRVMHAVDVVRPRLSACVAAPVMASTAAAAPLPGQALKAAAPVQAAPVQPAAPAKDRGMPSATPGTIKPAADPAASASASMAQGDGGPLGQPSTDNTDPGGALRSAINAVQRAGSNLSGRPTASAADAATATSSPAENRQASRASLDALLGAWQALPAGPAFERQMERDPAVLESTVQLVYETARAEARYADTLAASPGNAGLAGCLPGSRDDALLLKIALAPDEIEQQ